MRSLTLAVLGIACFLGVAQGFDYGKPGYYDGYQVLNVVPTTEKQVKHIRKLMDVEPTVDFWKEARKVGQTAEFLVHPSTVSKVKNYLGQSGLRIKTRLRNMESVIAKNREEFRRRSEMNIASFDYDNYNSYDAVMTEADDMVSRCPSGFQCEVYSIGNSYEGRPMKVLKIYKNEPNRPVYWMDSLIHAREWLAGAVLMKMVKHMIDDAGSDSDVQRLLNKGDWHFLLIHNPDGYEYSRTTARLWRKNRYNETNILNPSGPGWAGIDLNRNYLHRWRNSGSTHNQASGVYGGAFPGSEVETQNVVNEVYELQSRLKAFVSIHTAAKMILMPLSTVLDPGVEERCEYLEPEEHEKTNNVAQAMARAIEATHGVHQWQAGTSCDILYPCGGTTADFVYGFTGLIYSYTPELRDMDNEGNEYSSIFEAPPSEIHPAYQETWNGIVAMVDEIDRQN